MSGVTECPAWVYLTARAIQYDGAGGKGHGGLTPADVAAALGGLAEGPFLTGMFVEAGAWSCLLPLEREIYLAVLKMSDDEEWNMPKGTRPLRRLGHLALYELVGPATGCPECDGEGSIEEQYTSTRAICDRCGGRGKLPLTSKTRAGLIDVGEGQWSRVWGGRYDAVFGHVRGWLDDANKHLRDRLRNVPVKAA